MTYESSFLIAAALGFVLGVRFVLGSPILRTGPVAFLMIVAVLSTSAGLILALFPQSFVRGGLLTELLEALAASAPPFVAFVAGFGYRRHYRVVFAASLGLFLLICLRLLPLTAFYPVELAVAVDAAERLIIAGFLFYAATSYWNGRRDDTDRRRRLSRFFLAPTALIVTGVALLLPATSLALAGLLALLLATTLLALLNAKRPPRDLSFTDYQEKFERFTYYFEKRRIYREDDLTLERIGDRLLLDNNRVRFLIHKGLGYRRVSDLLDTYRVEAAKVMLSDIEEAQTSLGEISVSVGYGGQGAFVEAFTRMVGESPEDYRRHHINLADENRPLQLTNTDR